MSLTQLFSVGDVFVPHSMELAPEGFTLVNDGRIFTPYWTEYVIAKPGIGGGANWPPTSIDAEAGIIYVCAADGATVFRAWEIPSESPPAGELPCDTLSKMLPHALRPWGPLETAEQDPSPPPHPGQAHQPAPVASA